jgi:predicted amidohydrolase YtcJ
MRTVANAGGIVSAGSDWFVSSLNPLLAIQVAVTRFSPLAVDSVAPENRTAWIPEEVLDLNTVLQAYTRNAAYAMWQDSLTGHIRENRQADLIVFDRNFFDGSMYDIAKSKVLLTLKDGREVWRDPSFTS